MKTKYDLKVFRDLCKKNNLKVTPQREAIYIAVVSENNHPTADVIFKKIKKKLPNITFDTVNRTLKTFSDINILNFIPAYNAPRRYDAILKEHHHCHCIVCHKIIDIYYEPYNDIKLPDELPVGFKPNTPVIIIEGVCSDCS